MEAGNSRQEGDKRKRQKGQSQAGVERKRQSGKSQEGERMKQQSGQIQVGNKRKRQAGQSQGRVKRKRQSAQSQDQDNRKKHAGLSQEGDKRKRQTRQSQQRDRRKQQARTSMKRTNRKRQQGRQFGIMSKVRLSSNKAKQDEALKLRNSSSSSESSDHREILDYNDKTQFFPVVDKKQHLLKDGVPRLKKIARQCLVNLPGPNLRELLKGTPFKLLKEHKVLSKLDPKQLFEIEKWRRKDDTNMTEEYWKKFCGGGGINLLEEIKPNKQISYKKLYLKASGFYRKEAKQVDKKGQQWKKSSGFIKINDPEYQIPKWEYHSDDEVHDTTGDLLSENSDYPSDPDDWESETSDLPSDSDLHSSW